MTATRKALLISNPGETGAENYCKGVFVDVRNYSRMLCSPHGGAWQQGDIVHLSRPSKTELREAVKGLAPYTYSFIVFSGHGWYSSVERCNVLTLRKGEEVASLELLAGASRRTVILDCCRKVYHETIEESVKRAMLFNTAALSAGRQADPAKCRALFLDLVSKTPTGVVEISSCNIGETAGDDETQGGRYSSSLIAAADMWADAETKKPLWSGDNSASIVAAHTQAADGTQRRSGGTQNPTITKPRSGDYFPFTVFAS